MFSPRKIYLFALSIVFVSLPLVGYAKYGDTKTFISQTAWGDGQNRTAIYLDFPNDVAQDSAGNFYVADTYNDSIRKVDVNGVVSTVYGTGSYGHALTQLALPQGVAVDSKGNLYVADTENGQIKKIHDGTGSILVSGLKHPTGVAVQAGVVYFVDATANSLSAVSTKGGKVTTITKQLSGPKKLWLTGSTAYVANAGSYQLVKVDLITKLVSVVAGTGQAGNQQGACATASFTNIWGVTGDGANMLYVSDGNGLTNFLRKIDLTTCTVSLFVNDPSMNSSDYPTGLLYQAGQLDVTYSGIGVIQRYNVTNPTDKETLIGSSRFQTDNARQLVGRPVAMAQHGTMIYVIQNNQVSVINRTTKAIQSIAGNVIDNYKEAKDDKARFSSPSSLAINQAGTILYISDRWNHRIRKIDLATNTTAYLTGAGITNGTGTQNNGYAEGRACLNEFNSKVINCAYFNQPVGIALSLDEQTLYVADAGNDVIRSVDVASGQTQLVAGTPQVAGFVNGVGSKAKFHTPWSLVLNAAGNKLYITDRDNNAIRVLNLTTKGVKTLTGNGSSGYADGTFSIARFSLPDTIVRYGQKLYVAEAGSQRIRLLDLQLKVTKLVAGSGVTGFLNGNAKLTQWTGPMGMVAGKNKLLVADYRNDQIRTINIRGVAPFANPAPSVTSVVPGSNNSVNHTDPTISLTVNGSNFRYGAIAYFGSFQALHTYVNSTNRITVVLPFSKMQPGYYQVKVKNTDTQAGKLTRGYTVSNNDGSVPNVDYLAK